MSYSYPYFLRRIFVQKTFKLTQLLTLMERLSSPKVKGHLVVGAAYGAEHGNLQVPCLNRAAEPPRRSGNKHDHEHVTSLDPVECCEGQ
jgi:hypothetical protein